MKIKRINLNKLRNEEWFNFFTEFKTFVEEFYPQAQNIEELFPLFLNLYSMADTALDKITKSEFTSTIVQLDEKRDNTFRGLVATAKAALFHYEDDKRAIAKKIVDLFDHYGNLAVKSYNEETASIYNLLQDLRGDYAGIVRALSLSGWVDALDKNNCDFEKAILDRNRESAGKTDVNMVEVRAKANRCYLDIIERFEALMLVQGDGDFAPFVKTLNNNIDRYNTALKRHSRGGRKNEPGESG
jgi:hypothetical protein